MPSRPTWKSHHASNRCSHCMCLAAPFAAKVQVGAKGAPTACSKAHRIGSLNIERLKEADGLEYVLERPLQGGRGKSLQSCLFALGLRRKKWLWKGLVFIFHLTISGDLIIWWHFLWYCPHHTSQVTVQVGPESMTCRPEWLMGPWEFLKGWGGEH